MLGDARRLGDGAHRKAGGGGDALHDAVETRRALGHDHPDLEQKGHC